MSDKKISPKKIYIGTRKSDLALAQGHQIKKLITDLNTTYQENPQLIEIKTFKTSGDRLLDQSLAEIGGKGLFTKEIEEALLSKEIDIAVHSMKDMPAINPEGTEIIATPKREDPHDAFISAKYNSIAELPNKAIIGTASSRRKALLLKIRPDLQIVNFRGNVNRRLSKIEAEEVQGTILAVAGLNRINMQQHIKEIISPNIMLPAIAQGAIGAQIRQNDNFVHELVTKINHPETYICIQAERAFLKAIDGSCKTPIAAYAYIENNLLHLTALISKPDGTESYQAKRSGSLEDAEIMGRDAGLEIQKNAPHIVDLFTK